MKILRRKHKYWEKFIYPFIWLFHQKNVSDNEILARYVFSSDAFSRDRRTVKSGAFGGKGHVSVYQIRGLTDAIIWALSTLVTKKLPCRGYAQITVEQVKTVQGKKNKYLEVQSWPSPHKRHANIKNFIHVPKAAELSSRAQLARLATPVIHPDYR